MSDVWAQAEQARTSTTAPAAGGESRQDAYSQGSSRLFGAEGGAPSWFNKSHPVGTERTGIITKEPYDQQRTKMGSGEPLFWQAGSKSPVIDAVNTATGQKNRPVMDTVIELDTEYVMDGAEATALNREAPYDGTDRRDFVGKELKAFKEAIADAVKRGIQLTCDADMVGKRLTKKRISTKPNPHGGEPIKVHAYRIDNA